METNTKLLRADAIAQMLDVSKQRVYELTREKKIPFIQVGERQYRYSRSAVMQWIETGGTIEGAFENNERE